tara:strand:+ start:450 stop:557 length:108 start_codon:yes stop_codon:yes gene_type:complete
MICAVRAVVEKLGAKGRNKVVKFISASEITLVFVP